MNRNVVPETSLPQVRPITKRVHLFASYPLTIKTLTTYQILRCTPATVGIFLACISKCKLIEIIEAEVGSGGAFYKQDNLPRMIGKMFGHMEDCG